MPDTAVTPIAVDPPAVDFYDVLCPHLFDQHGPCEQCDNLDYLAHLAKTEKDFGDDGAPPRPTRPERTPMPGFRFCAARDDYGNKMLDRYEIVVDGAVIGHVKGGLRNTYGREWRAAATLADGRKVMAYDFHSRKAAAARLLARIEEAGTGGTDET